MVRMCIDYDAVEMHIERAIDEMGVTTTHDDAVCEDRLREALMWLRRARTTNSVGSAGRDE